MQRVVTVNAILTAIAASWPLASVAAAPQGRPELPVLKDAEAWKRLPAETGGNQPLPSWARTLVGAIPRTTGALLRVDYAHRAQSSLDPKLRAKMRLVAARTNHCAYSEAYALFDARRAGLDDAAVKELSQGNFSSGTPAQVAALAFAQKMTADPASVTDDQFAALVRQHGEKNVVAMVQLMAWANFQDRVILCLGSTVEADGPLPPLDVTFAPGFLITRQPATQRGQTQASTPLPPGAGKDLIDDDSDWTDVSYDELQVRLERQRSRSTRLRVPTWEEVERALPPNFMWPNRVVWNLVCLGYQPVLGGAWETYLRTSAVETAGEMSRVFGQSLFWVTTRAINCPYCMGHCEMGLELAGLSKPAIQERTRLLAGDDWSSFPAEEQRAYAFARKLTKAPWTVSDNDIDGLVRDFGPNKALVVIVAACRGHYMTRISNGFQLSLERDNVFRDWLPKIPASPQPATGSSSR
jgi:alkylhydroperoxidase family enzyme